MSPSIAAKTGLALGLPVEYGYVGLIGAGLFWLNIFQQMQVNKHRKAVSSNLPDFRVLLTRKTLVWNQVSSIHGR
jgi:hypothetical protein